MPWTICTQNDYPLLESLLRIKSLSLQPTYTNADVASLFGVSTRTIKSRTADRSLPSRRLIGRARFPPVDLKSFLSQSRSVLGT
jgi:hypothetical protein